MCIEQQIDELRAEFTACIDRQEISQIAAELHAALAEHARIEAEIAAMFAASD